MGRGALAPATRWSDGRFTSGPAARAVRAGLSRDGLMRGLGPPVGDGTWRRARRQRDCLVYRSKSADPYLGIYVFCLRDGRLAIPTEMLQVAQARPLVGEPLEQLVPVARVVNPGSRMLTSHRARLRPQGGGSG